MGSTTGDLVAAVGDVVRAGAGELTWAVADDVCWAGAGGVGSFASSLAGGEEAVISIFVGDVAATGCAAAGGVAAAAGRRIRLACSTAR
uniref:Uncharacterized protein n=1 Tax=Romanomermis culicivorax TaxID=13658 RepID=A0A915IRH1_ROMCU